MPWDGRAPADRATARLFIVLGAIAMVIGVGVFVSGVVNGSLADTSPRGIPIWILAPLIAAFGGWAAWQGVAMYRADKPPRS